MFNEKFSAFKVVDILPLIFSLLIILAFIMIAIAFGAMDKLFVTADVKINKFGNFTQTNWERLYFNEKKNIENPICFSSVHGLSLLKIMSLAFASLMKNQKLQLIIMKEHFLKRVSKK